MNRTLALPALLLAACFDFAGLKSGPRVDAGVDLAGGDLTFVFQGCANGSKDNDESDVDCGGTSCPRCLDGKVCAQPTDCASNRCDAGRCAPPPASCADQAKNNDESDVDCGGATCPRCADGRSCAQDADCASNRCMNNLCVAGGGPACNDNQKNGQESDVDCGGPTCPKCAIGRACTQAADCASNKCANALCGALGPLKNVNFAAPVEYTIAMNTVSRIRVADANADGKDDVVAVWGRIGGIPEEARLLATHLGKGDGTLQMPLTQEIRWLRDLAVADFNGDKFLDVAASAPAAPQAVDRLVIYTGNGNGTFKQGPGLLMGGLPDQVSAVDLDANGRPDLFYSGYDEMRDARHGVLFNVGNLTFQPARQFNFGLRQRQAFALVDLNRDTLFEYLVFNPQGGMSTAVTAGVPLPQLFDERQPKSYSGNSGIVADFDKDNRPDLLNLLISDPMFHAGKGDGTFAPLGSEIISRDNVKEKAGVATADVNLDGNLDLLFGNAMSAKISVNLGGGDGRFGPGLVFPAGGKFDLFAPYDTEFLVADFNRDGKPDLVSILDHRLFVMLNTSQ